MVLNCLERELASPSLAPNLCFSANGLESAGDFVQVYRHASTYPKHMQISVIRNTYSAVLTEHKMARSFTIFLSYCFFFQIVTLVHSKPPIFITFTSIYLSLPCSAPLSNLCLSTADSLGGFWLMQRGTSLTALKSINNIIKCSHVKER